MKTEVTPPGGLLDYTKLCRDSKKISTVVYLYPGGYDKVEWMRLGQISLCQRDSSHFRGQWVFDAFLENATDFEHDSAKVFRMELVGVTLDMLWYGRTDVIGWIKGGDPRSFHVGGPEYDPRKLPGAKRCKMKECGVDHIMVPEGFYIPPENPDLYAQVAGCKVEIITSISKDT